MKKEYSRIPWEDYSRSKTPIGNPKQCCAFEIQGDGTPKVLFLSDDNGVHVNIIKSMT